MAYGMPEKMNFRWFGSAIRYAPSRDYPNGGVQTVSVNTFSRKVAVAQLLKMAAKFDGKLIEQVRELDPLNEYEMATYVRTP